MKRYLLFALVGPFLGGFCLLLVTTYQSGYWSHPPSVAEIGKLVSVFAMTLQYTYLFGFLPALMMAAVEDILFHVKSIGSALRIILVGAIAFVFAALAYGSRGADSGALQFILYGLVGFLPATVSAWLVNRYVEEPQSARAA
jgi:Family of unknown function (DUF5413)